MKGGATVKIRLLVIVAFGMVVIPILFASVPALAMDSHIDSLVIQGRDLVDSGYVQWNKEEMLHGYSLLERAAALARNNRYPQYYLAYAGYRLMTYGMSIKEDSIYKEFADPAEKLAEKLVKDYAKLAEPKALLASIYGVEIAHNWTKSVTLGPESEDLAREALSIDSTNPRAYIVLGAGKLNTPGIFGGSVSKAVEYFKESVSLFESA